MQYAFFGFDPGGGQALHGGGGKVKTPCAVGSDGVFHRVGAGGKEFDVDVEAVGRPGELCGYRAYLGI